MNADWSDPRVVVEASDSVERFTAWSPDGTQIVFQSDRTDGIFNVFVMNAGGSDPVQLTDDPVRAGRPHWLRHQ